MSGDEPILGVQKQQQRFLLLSLRMAGTPTRGRDSFPTIFGSKKAFLPSTFGEQARERIRDEKELLLPTEEPS